MWGCEFGGENLVEVTSLLFTLFVQPIQFQWLEFNLFCNWLIKWMEQLMEDKQASDFTEHSVYITHSDNWVHCVFIWLLSWTSPPCVRRQKRWRWSKIKQMNKISFDCFSVHRSILIHILYKQRPESRLSDVPTGSSRCCCFSQSEALIERLGLPWLYQPKLNGSSTDFIMSPEWERKKKELVWVYCSDRTTREGRDQSFVQSQVHEQKLPVLKMYFFSFMVFMFFFVKWRQIQGRFFFFFFSWGCAALCGNLK